LKVAKISSCFAVCCHSVRARARAESRAGSRIRARTERPRPGKETVPRARFSRRFPLRLYRTLWRKESARSRNSGSQRSGGTDSGLSVALTFPNHHSIVTGLYPEHHGIVADIPLVHFVAGSCGIASPSERGSAPAKFTLRFVSLTTASPWPTVKENGSSSSI
jgi:Type I phosphodiesterase / nucleotide pyrophosphatase